MPFVGAFCLFIFSLMLDNVSGSFRGSYYSSKPSLESSSKLTLQLNCSDGVPIPPITIDKAFTRDEEKRVLQNFYIETSGYNWTKRRPGWTSYDNGTEIDHCHWAGVTCDKVSGYVTGLSINKNNLVGRVPNFLWKLRNLMLLCLPSNPGLKGELKDFLFPNMSKLLRIDLAFCSLSGTLPNDLFSSLKSLVKIQLCCQIPKEGIYGSIPESISELKDLRVLSLGENSLIGSIPKGIGKLPKVWFLDLEFMSLSGNISNFLGMTSLKKMHLSCAGLYGDFPDNFGSYFPDMREIQLPNNSISGHIPTSVNKMKKLTKLILSGNRLRGKLPKELSDLPSLRILDLSHNSELQSLEEGLRFRGSPNLEIFVLRHNPSLTARFQDLVSALQPQAPELNPSALRILDISYCNFKGSISSLIWTFTSLIELNLKHNKLSGQIPSVLDDLMFLTYADFSDNPLLKGAIPNNFLLLQSLRVFDIRNNTLMRAPFEGVNESNGVIQNIMRIDPNSRMKGANCSCPYAKLVSNNGNVLLDPSYYYSRFCVCDHGFFGHLGHCKKCITGGDCTSYKNLNYGNTKIYLKLKKGYWPCPSPDNTKHLVRCPGRLDIDGTDVACNPSGQCQCWINTSAPDLRTVCDTSCLCHSGNTKRLCSKCEKNYFKNGYLCKECSKPSLSFYFAIPLVIICLLALWGAFKFCKERIQVKFGVVAIEFIILIIMRSMDIISGWIFEISVVVLLFYMAGIMKNTRGLVTILVFHIQVLDALISSTETPFPLFVYSIQHYTSSVFNLNFPGISCSLQFLFTPLGKYLVVFLFPLGCLATIWIYYGFRWAIHTFLSRNQDQRELEQRQSALKDVMFQCLKLSITCLILTYFPIMKHTLAVILPCDQDDDASFMRLAPWIKCDGSDKTYEALQILGWLAIIIYGFAELIALMALLRWYKFNNDNNQFSEEQKKVCNSWLGSIYLPYIKDVQGYFEVWKLFRKLLIAFLLAFIPNTSSIQTFTIALVLTIALVYQVKVEPYKRHEGGNFENYLEALSLIILQQSVILLRFASYDLKNTKGMVSTVIAINIFFLSAFMVAIISVLINLFSTNNQDNDERRPLLQEGNAQRQGQQ